MCVLLELAAALLMRCHCVCVLCQGLGCLMWQDVAHRVMVVTPEGHSEVKRFWKRQKSQA